MVTGRDVELAQPVSAATPEQATAGQVRRKATIAPIADADVAAVADFLHTHLNERVATHAWERALRVPWPVDQPNHGFLLRVGDDLVGAYVAYYSTREIAGRTLDICNLGAWCVLEEHRFAGLRLLKTVLAQPGFEFTDLSPSGNVVALNKRLNFTSLDTTTALTINLTGLLSGPSVHVSSDPATLQRLLCPSEQKIYHDHRDTAAARHVVLTHGERSCYVIFRHDRRKELPFFVSVLYASDPELLHRGYGAFTRFVLLRHGALATLAELRVVGGRRPRWSRTLSRSRPKMFKSTALRPEDVDYLYSELVCLEW